MRCEGVPPESSSVSTQDRKLARCAPLRPLRLFLQAVVFSGMVLQLLFIDCQLRRIRSSATFSAEKVWRSAALSVAMPDGPMLPESSTDTMTLGAGSRLALPAGY